MHGYIFFWIREILRRFFQWKSNECLSYYPHTIHQLMYCLRSLCNPIIELNIVSWRLTYSANTFSWFTADQEWLEMWTCSSSFQTCFYKMLFLAITAMKFCFNPSLILSAACAMASITDSQSGTDTMLEHSSSHQPIKADQGVQPGRRIRLITRCFLNTL